MKVDWQRFDDGLLGLEERDRAIEALSNDPQASRELEGLRTFKALVHDAVMDEPVPLGRLEQRLAEAMRQPVVRKPIVRPWLVAAVLAAAVLIAGALAFYSPTGDDGTLEVIKVSSPAEASQVASSRSSLALPPIDLGNLGRVDAVHAGSYWACYDFTVAGETIHVGMDYSQCKTDGLESVETEYGTAYIDTKAATVLFNKDKIYYAVYGADQETRVSVAKRALQSLAKPD